MTGVRLSSDASQLEARGSDERTVAAGARFLAEHSRRDLPVARLAAAMGYSVSHARRLFTRVARVPPNHYLAAVRMEDAKHLLAHTDHTVLQVCHEVGYDSLGTFTRRFTEAVGVSPSRYRAIAQSGDIDQLSPPPHVVGPRGRVVGAVRGSVRLDAAAAGEWSSAWVGLFPRPVPVGRPLAGAVVPDGDTFEIPLPERPCWLLAVSFPRGRRGAPLVAGTDRVVTDGDVVDLVLVPWQRHDHPLTVVLGVRTVENVSDSEKTPHPAARQAGAHDDRHHCCPRGRRGRVR